MPGLPKKQMPRPEEEKGLQRKIIDENRRVHALENRLYLRRHPEQTNWWQKRLLNETLDDYCDRLNLPGARLLDAGCGTGYVYLPLLTRGYNMTGVDLSAEMVGVLEESLPEEFRARSHLVVTEVEEFIENCEEPFDGVILSALLHHLYDYEKVARLICKVLKPGGLLLIFFEPLRQAILSPIRYAIHKNLARIDEAFYRKEMRFRRIQILEDEYEYSDYQRNFGGIDSERLAKVLEGEGMKIINMTKYCTRRNGLAAWLANAALKTVNTFNLLVIKKV